ncbi:SRPBCC family protein [Streptomyces ovatisporus]|uniref:SRPBCC family protein n=1 Tax=Streptomyces ovatisporus TaxID=1128682 RepID=A0ABV9A908_9ACTN
MSSTRYRFRFRSVWRLPAPPERVFAVLERGDEYPAWWPQVREVHGAEGGADAGGRARIRSVLPYDLWITGRGTRRDPAAGVLEMEIGGDLAGWARWTVGGAGDGHGGSTAVYEQQVEVRKPLLRLLTLLGRPLLRANHAWMMRSGRRGLRRWLGRGLDDG